MKQGILISIISIIFILIFLILGIYSFLISNIVIYQISLFAIDIILALNIWSIVGEKARERKKQNQPLGRVFEMFFFMFLFLSTYTVAFAISGWYRFEMSLVIVFSLISVAYCGMFHYYEGLFNSVFSKN